MSWFMNKPAFCICEKSADQLHISAWIQLLNQKPCVSLPRKKVLSSFSEISCLQLAPVAMKPALCLTLSETSKFNRKKAHIL